MSDYQAVYDAVRSRFFGDFQNIFRDAVKVDISHSEAMVRDAFLSASEKMCRPSVLFKPTITQDGNAFVALYGPDLAVGIVGTGDTPSAAMNDFDAAWFRKVSV